MGKKNKLDNKMPGPGTYNPSLKPVTPREPAFSIACKPPPPHQDETNPGPGAYTVEPSHPRFGPCFTIPGRHATTRELEERALMPGPGAYNGDSEVVHAREPSYSILGRRVSYPREITPGPGAYGPASVDGTGPSFTILGKRDGPYLSSAMAEIPGPGAYNATVEALRPKSPSISIAGRYGRRLEDDGPGPGQYGKPSTLSGPSFSMARRRAAHLADESPGPGQYSTDTGLSFLARKEPSYSMASRPRAHTADVNVPGPGSYNPSSAEGRSRACVILGRQPARKIETSPGPGAYFWKATKRPVTPAYTIAGRHPKSVPDSGPGPGAYSPPDTNWGGPAYTMSSRKPSKPVRESPGPGEYKVTGNRLIDAAPAFSIGVRLPPPKAPDPVPGPGAYGARSSLGGPAYTLTSRGEE